MLKKTDNLKDIFELTSVEVGITPAAAEKDYWICWVLWKIFSDDFLGKIFRFKGGTSLSKCFHLIERFSEDIDLILDWTQLTDEDPEALRSKTQQDHFNKNLNKEAQAFISKTILPKLNQLFRTICTASIDDSDKHVINITYSSYYPPGYLRPQVKLEIGPLAAMIPYNNERVVSYCEFHFPDSFETADFEIPTIAVERTFWEKATILHTESHRPKDKPVPPRYSRHYYDLYKMCISPYVTTSLARLELLDQVRTFKEKFYPSSWANYEMAKPGSFKLLPPMVSPDLYRQDYSAMAEMIFGEVPSWEVILEGLKKLESEINSLA